MKAQISTELLMVLGLLLLLFSGAFAMVYYKLLSSEKELSVLRTELSLSNLASAVDAVYSSDALVVDLSFPKEAISFEAKDHMLKVSVAGKGDIVRFTKAKIINNIPNGIIPQRVLVKKEQDGVSLNLADQ